MKKLSTNDRIMRLVCIGFILYAVGIVGVDFFNLNEMVAIVFSLVGGLLIASIAFIKT